MSSTNPKLVSCLLPMLTVPKCPSKICCHVSVMCRSKKTLKSMGDSRYPCLTPSFVLNHSPIDPTYEVETDIVRSFTTL